MQAQAKSLSDQDIMDLAAYLSDGDSVEASAAVVSKAGQEKTAACAACHGASGVSPKTMMPIAPILAGQYSEYIEQALTQYQKGDRSGGNAAIMTGMAAPLTEDDIKLLAEFYAAQGGLKTTQK
jgi:cytochrome c553